MLTEMQANGVRLSNFIQNLLTYTSLKVDRLEMHYEVGDINECLREIAEFWAQRFHDKAIAFYFLPDEKLPLSRSISTRCSTWFPTFSTTR